MTAEKKPGYDIRSILEEMKDEYWQGLSEAEEAGEEQQEYITFVLGGETFAFETVYATEVIRVPKLVKIPRVQELIAGVFNLRGEITAAMDIRPLLGLPQPAISATGRIIVVKSERFATGILTEKVEGVTPLPVNGLEPVITSLGGAPREYIRGQLNLDGRLVMMLDIAKLMNAPEIVVEHNP